MPKRAAVYPAYANRQSQSELIKRFFGAGSADSRREVEDRLTDALEKRTGTRSQVLVYCPSGSMQLKSARMLVHWPGQDGLSPLNDFRDQVSRIGDLEQAYHRMWKFYVMVMSDDSQQIKVLSELCAEEFSDSTNLLAAK